MGHTNNDKETDPKVGLVKDVTLPVITPAYPWIEAFDIWVDGRDNQRYLIRQPQTHAEFSGFPYMYSINLKLIAKTDILYSEDANEIVKNEAGDQDTDNNWRPNLELDY